MPTSRLLATQAALELLPLDLSGMWKSLPVRNVGLRCSLPVLRWEVGWLDDDWRQGNPDRES